MKKFIIFSMLMLICGCALAQDYIPSTDNSTTPQWNEELRKLRDGVSQSKSAIDLILPIDLSRYGTSVKNVLPVQAGGTGQTTSIAAMNSFLPDQSGNSGKYLTTDGSVYSWGTINLVPVYTASNNVIIADSTKASHISSGAYQKIKDITLFGSGSLTISFNLTCLRSIGSGTMIARIYRNDASVGAEQSVTCLNGGSNQTFSETISGWTNGDKVQIYGHYDNGSTSGDINNFILKGTSMAINLE